MEDEQKNAIITSIKKRFAFLLDNQYNLGSMKITGTMGRWEIELESDKTDVIYQIISDRNWVVLEIANREEKFWVSLKDVVFFITNKIIPLLGNDLKNLFEYDLDNQINELASVLKEGFSRAKVCFT